jgi:hypothetical protein
MTSVCGPALQGRRAPQLRKLPCPTGKNSRLNTFQIVAPKPKFPQTIQSDLGRPVVLRKTFRFALTPNHPIFRAVLHSQEGRLAIVTDVGCGMRWTLTARSATCNCTRADERATADGEVVWFWHPDADAKFAGAIPQATVARKPGHREEHEGNR